LYTVASPQFCKPSKPIWNPQKLNKSKRKTTESKALSRKKDLGLPPWVDNLLSSGFQPEGKVDVHVEW
jgi:hypothetical protein